MLNFGKNMQNLPKYAQMFLAIASCGLRVAESFFPIACSPAPEGISQLAFRFPGFSSLEHYLL